MTVNFTPSELKVTNDDFITEQDFESQLIEHEGSFYQDDEFMVFELADGKELVITYNLCVDGYTHYDGGDYFTPPSACVDVSNVDVEITDVTIDEYSIKLNTESEKVFLEVVNKNL